MSDVSKKSLSNVLELVKSIKDDLAEREPEKTEFTPRQAAAALGTALRKAIEEHQTELQKMKSLEIATLKKSTKIITVFDLMKFDGEDKIDLKNANDHEKRLQDGNGPGTVVPSDKTTAEVSQGEGSGGQKGSKTVFDYLKAAKAVKKDEMPGTGAGMWRNGFTASEKPMDGGLEKVAGPRLGGKDPGSQMMTQHAFSAAPKAPAAPTPPATKPPTMEEHAKRAQMFDDFRPSKFGKKEYEGEVCPYCKQGMSHCKCK